MTNSKTLLLRLLIIVIILPSFVHADSHVLRVGGTGGALGGVKKVAEAFRKKHPEFKVNIAPSLGSSGGIKALLSGALDIAISSRPPTSEEAKQEAVYFEYARTLFVFVTSQKGELLDLTRQRLASIYSGERKTWSDGTPLRLILRPAGDTDNTYLRRISPGMERAVLSALSREGMVTAITDQENADVIEQIRGGFGAATLAQVEVENRKLRMMSVDGIFPSIATLKDGSYPYTRSFFIITAKPRPAVQAFVHFLQSREGRDILEKTGHLVPRKTNKE